MNMYYIFIITAPFNNMQTRKVKAQLRFTFYAAANHYYGNKHGPLKTETDKMDLNLPITTHKQDHFDNFAGNVSVSSDVC